MSAEFRPEPPVDHAVAEAIGRAAEILAAIEHTGADLLARLRVESDRARAAMDSLEGELGRHRADVATLLEQVVMLRESTRRSAIAQSAGEVPIDDVERETPFDRYARSVIEAAWAERRAIIERADGLLAQAMRVHSMAIDEFERIIASARAEADRITSKARQVAGTVAEANPAGGPQAAAIHADTADRSAAATRGEIAARLEAARAEVHRLIADVRSAGDR